MIRWFKAHFPALERLSKDASTLSEAGISIIEAQFGVHSFKRSWASTSAKIQSGKSVLCSLGFSKYKDMTGPG